MLLWHQKALAITARAFKNQRSSTFHLLASVSPSLQIRFPYIFLKQMYMIYLNFMLWSLCLFICSFAMSRLQPLFLRKFFVGRVSPPPICILISWLSIDNDGETLSEMVSPFLYRGFTHILASITRWKPIDKWIIFDNSKGETLLRGVHPI